MKNALGFILVAASLLLASGAQAQTLRVRANVPFDFVAGDTVYTAGSYDIQNVSSAIVLRNEGKSESRLTIPHMCSSATPAKQTVLVFHRVGDEYFLYQIWTAGSDSGREFPAPKRETQLAQNGAKSEEVIVAANLTK
jgi:hypothetical protein